MVVFHIFHFLLYSHIPVAWPGRSARHCPLCLVSQKVRSGKSSLVMLYRTQLSYKGFVVTYPLCSGPCCDQTQPSISYIQTHVEWVTTAVSISSEKGHLVSCQVSLSCSRDILGDIWPRVGRLLWPGMTGLTARISKMYSQNITVLSLNLFVHLEYKIKFLLLISVRVKCFLKLCRKLCFLGGYTKYMSVCRQFSRLGAGRVGDILYWY